jgi:hypothetical protein
LHDIGGLAESIRRYGFKEPVRWEPSLNGGTGGIVAGNGRIATLQFMQSQGDPLPRGILEDQATGEWLVPVLFGVDAASELQAQAYAIDANSLVVTGGDTAIWDILRLYERQQLAEIVEALEQQGQHLVTFDAEAMHVVRDREAEPPETDKAEVVRWAFTAEFEDTRELLEELEGLLGPWLKPYSKRKLIPQVFVEMVRAYARQQGRDV